MKKLIKKIIYICPGVICFFVVGIFCQFFMDAVMAKEKIVERDTNKDGKTDQAICFDLNGKVLKLEIDSNNDGVMDRFQYYQNGALVRIESDLDNDQQIDAWDYFNKEKRIRHEGANSLGNVNQVVFFDEKESPLRIEKDSTGDGKFDTVYNYKDGTIFSLTKDTDQDEKVNIWQTFQAGKPVERKVDDDDGDGKAERISRYNSMGFCEKSLHDLDNDGKHEVLRLYSKGEVYVQKCDSDRDGFFETVSLYKKGKLYLQTKDKNKNGKPDVKIFYDQKEKKKRVETDSDLNGAADIWEYYTAGRIIRLEKDSANTGKIDTKVFFKDEKKEKLIKDIDGDGNFETTQWFNRLKWSIVTEVDGNNDKNVDFRYFYKGGVLRLKEVDEDENGVVDIKEHYDKNGKLVKREEEHENAGYLNIVWFYNNDEEAVKAEKDNNGNGHPDIWYFYKKNCLRRVEEDTNHDGKPDLWEKYDDSEVLISRTKDLDFDGKSDIEEINGENNGG